MSTEARREVSTWLKRTELIVAVELGLRVSVGVVEVPRDKSNMDIMLEEAAKEVPVRW